MLHHFLQFISIPCILCGQSQRLPASICEDCERDLPWLPKSCPKCAIPWPLHRLAPCPALNLAFDACSAAFAYQFPVQKLIVSFKDFDQLHLGRALSICLARQNLRAVLRPDQITGVPSHPHRLRERGFNPAELIAKDVSKILKIPCPQRLVEKVVATPLQKHQSKAGRLNNSENPFRLRKSVLGQHIGVIDDVVTSMATAHQMAQVLKSGGAKRVSIWSIARALPRLGPHSSP